MRNCFDINNAQNTKLDFHRFKRGITSAIRNPAHIAGRGIRQDMGATKIQTFAKRNYCGFHGLPAKMAFFSCVSPTSFYTKSPGGIISCQKI